MENEEYSLRIVQVLGGAEDGGLEKHTIELSHLLKKNRLDVSVIAHEKFENAFKGVEFIECDLSKSRNNPVILYKLYKILKKGNFDIIHTQANKATDMVIKLKPFLKSKIISTLHSYKKDTKSYEKADFVITVSDRIGENLKNQNKKTIYNGINLEKIKKIKKIDLYTRFGITKNSFILCAVGRFVKAKRFDLLLDTMELLNNNIHLFLVGDGDDKIRQKAKNLDNVTLCGYLSDKKTKEILKSSNLCVISSEKEGFSYVFAESLLLNTPLLSTDVADIKKFLPEISIVKLNKFDIAKKIDYFAENYESLLKMYKEKFTKAKKEFNFEKMVNKTIEVYKKVQN